MAEVSCAIAVKSFSTDRSCCIAVSQSTVFALLKTEDMICMTNQRQGGLQSTLSVNSLLHAAAVSAPW